MGHYDDMREEECARQRAAERKRRAEAIPGIIEKLQEARHAMRAYPLVIKHSTRMAGDIDVMVDLLALQLVS